MQNIFKNKLFILFSFILFVFFIFSFSSVFASSEDEIVTFYSEDFGCDVTINLPTGLGSNYQYYMINTLKLSGNYPYRVTVWCSNSEFLFNYVENGSCAYGTINNSPYFKFDMTENFIPTDFSSKSVDFENGNPRTVSGSTGLGKTIFSNTNVYNNNNELVFQGAPQAQGEAVQVELMKPTQVQEIPQQIVAVVMIVLPIFLGIFGVLLVLYLIKSKNLLQL